MWAIAAVPGEPAFITTAHDHFVFKWSAVSHRVLWRSPMEVLNIVITMYTVNVVLNTVKKSIMFEIRF